MMTLAIETFELTKKFPKARGWQGILKRAYDRPAVNGVSIKIDQGESFGLIGPNGAGKTTLIKLLSTLIAPTSGTAFVHGYNLSHEQEIKRTVGLVTSDERSFFWRLTGRQNLEFFAALNRIPGDEVNRRVKENAELLGLAEVIDRPFQTYSTGLRQRLSIARALLPKPRLLFLDEPTKGLDPESGTHLRNFLLERLKGLEGVTIFIASHDLNEIKNVCDRVAIMVEGKILACGTFEELADHVHQHNHYSVKVSGYGSIEAIENALNWIPDLEVRLLDKDIYQLGFDRSDEEVLGRVLSGIHNTGGNILDVDQFATSLDSIYSRVTKDESLMNSIENAAIGPPSQAKFGSKSEPVERKIPPFLGIVKAFLWRDLQIEMSYRLAFSLQFIQIVFSVAVFYFISRLVGPSANPYLADYGGDYFAFVLIGIAFSGFLGVGLSSFSNSIRQAQTTGTLEAMLSTPASFSSIILSSALWRYLMTSIHVLVYLLIGSIFLDAALQVEDLGAVGLILILSVIAFSSLGILAASFIMVLKRGNPITWVFGTLSSLLGGVYYPIEIMPDWLRFFSKLLPVTYALKGMRLVLLSGASFADISGDILALSLFCVILLPLGLLAFRYAVNRARQDGSLTHY